MRIVISGCSGGGKTTLLSMMGFNGYQVFSEPGRQIVQEQLNIGGSGLPWIDVEQFAELCITRSIDFYRTADENSYPAIYDRSYIDNLSALEFITSSRLSEYSDVTEKYRYHKKVYFTPPWEEIFTADNERRHSFADSLAEYSRLIESYAKYGYEIVELPKIDRISRFELLKDHIECDWNSCDDA